MTNIVARHFLNDRGFKQLESSEGAVNVVHKRKKNLRTRDFDFPT